MEHPILNPQNPYIGSLRVFQGTMVRFSGRPRPNATRFAINFQTGPSLNPRDDLALHLSPCFTPPRVVRNSLRHGAWGLEEAWGNGQILNPNQPFDIIILTESDQFKIAINGAHYCEFKHRIPFHEITHLSFDGDVDIDRITITSTQQTSPSSAPAYQQPQQPAYGGGGGHHHHASAPMPSANVNAPPYPTGPISMPMPSAYPILPPLPQPPHTGGGGGGYNPSATAYPPAMPQGPAPTGNSYMSGGVGGYPAMPGAPAGHYPPAGGSHYPPPGGPAPTGASYQQVSSSGEVCELNLLFV